MTNPAETYVLYHHDCNDGFGAAYAAWTHVGDHGPLGKTEYLPWSYGQEPPRLNPAAALYILDFSFTREQMLELIRRHHGMVTILDHHITALNEIGDLPQCHFDLEHSAARMAWSHFQHLAAEDSCQSHQCPELIDYIEDRDLWKWQLPQSREVSAALYSYPHDFPVWQQLVDDPNGIQRLKSEGETLLRAQRQEVQRLANAAFMQPVPGHHQPVPQVNTQTFVSEVCHELLARFPETPFAAAYHHAVNAAGEPVTKFSLRGRNEGENRFDVATLAEQNGGGGHPSAAGFTIAGHR